MGGRSTDGIYLLNYLLLVGAPPPEPFEGCGPDPAEPADAVAQHADRR